jgi:hypothetical protein
MTAQNITPAHLRCVYAAACPSVHRITVDGKEMLLIVGRMAGRESRRLGLAYADNERAILISPEYFSGLVQEWQPIETCPNYTEVFLAYQADGVSHKVSKFGIGQYSGSPDNLDGKEILWSWGWAMEPTHWMPIRPLPSPPASQEGT